MLPFIADAEDPWHIVATLRDALAPGSYLVLCHGTDEGQPAMIQAMDKVYNRNVAIRAGARSRADILRFFDGFRLVPPGLVDPSLWRPDPADAEPDAPGQVWGLAGVGQMP